MTSKWSQSASATRRDSSARRAKSADSRLGAIKGSRDTSAESRRGRDTSFAHAEDGRPCRSAPSLRHVSDGRLTQAWADAQAERAAAVGWEPPDWDAALQR